MLCFSWFEVSWEDWCTLWGFSVSSNYVEGSELLWWVSSSLSDPQIVVLVHLLIVTVTLVNALTFTNVTHRRKS